MKKILLGILFILAAVSGYAQQPAPQATEDWCWGYLPGYPYYYCDCRNSSTEFSFPLETTITDTVWYQASVDDMKQGLSAYWFADCSVTFEVYAFCSSKAPTISMTVNANTMREMDVAKINQKLEEMGDMAELMSQVLTPRVRVYPNNGSGKVYCYPYDQGPLSTCDAPLPVIPRMTYVCSDSVEVYELKPEKMSPNGQGFIRWKQKNNQPGSIRLTLGSCDGSEIGNVTLADSARVYVIDSAQLVSAKNNNQSIFVHVSHPADYVGRMFYHNQIRWDAQQIDTTICQGIGLQLADTVLNETTFFAGDTLWKAGDTLFLTSYDLTIDTPETQYDTLRLKAAQLPYNYHNQIIPKDGWGDYDLTIHQADKCDERYLLHVEHDFVTNKTEIHDTLCLGKTVTYGDITYSTDTVIRDSVWTTADTWTIRDISIVFTDPETEYDTISVLPSKMKGNGYWYSDLGVLIREYGDTLIVKKKKNQCTRWIQLHVDVAANFIEGDTTLTICQGKTMTINNKAYANDTVINDTIMTADGETWLIGKITIQFKAPDMEYDTLAVNILQMTEEGYPYEGFMVHYGDTLIIKTAENECTRHIQLHVDTADIPVETIDTTLCEGKTIIIDDRIYASDTLWRDTVKTAGQWTIRDITIRFTAPEMEYDTLALAPAQLPAEGYWYEKLGVTIRNFGDTLITKTADNECTRHIQLHVASTEAIDHTVDPAYNGTYKYMLNGVLYIRRGEEDYDLLGRPINRK